MRASNSRTGSARPDRCGICHTAAELAFRERFREYTLWECSRCDGQFWTPMESPGAAWYEKDDRYAFRNLNPLTKPERNHREFLKDLPTSPGPGSSPKLVDLGMGTGNFLAAAVRAGYDGYGIDFDVHAIEAAKRVFGLTNVYAFGIPELRAKCGAHTFDVITMFEVIEHLDDPLGYVAEAKLLLKSEGYLALSIPHRRCPDFLKVHDRPPRHLTRWNETSTARFLEMQGFMIVRLKAIPISIPYLVTKFHFWCRRWTSFNLVQRVQGSGFENTEAAPRALSERATFALKLARLKDYVLFGIPAVALKLWLRITGRDTLGLYVLARLP